jgi:transposase-like protein
MAYGARDSQADGSTDSTEPLKGHVEVDETYVGGRRRGKRGRGAEGKTAVVGMVERGGNVKAKVVANTMMSTLTKEVIQSVVQGAQISTDEYNAYNSLSANGYIHGVVKHGAKQYVNGQWHTQSIEGFWSRLKVSVSGTHVWVSKKHLQKYVDEFAFRYNMRQNPGLMFDLLLGQMKRHA